MHITSNFKYRGKIVSYRELEILNLIAFEYSTEQIAAELNISFETVKSHRKKLFIKLCVKNAAGLVRVAFENNLINYTPL
jgi:DNA-binding NarL/FixJ family response regulator